MRLIREDAARLTGPSDDDRLDADVAGPAAGTARRTIEIAFIQDRQRRHISFSKRKAGLMKKAHELATLTGTQLLLLIVSESGLVYTYTTDRMQPLVAAQQGQQLIQQCLSAEPAAAVGTGSPDKRSAPPACASAERQPARSLKKRRTMDDLLNRPALSAPPTPERRPIISPGQRAQAALDAARARPVLAELMQAFQLHDDVHRSAATDGRGNISSALSHLMLSVQTCATEAGLQYERLDPQKHGLDRLEEALSDFVTRYIPMTLTSARSVAADVILGDLAMWIRWLHQEHFLPAARCAALLDRLRPAAPRRIASNARLRQRAATDGAEAAGDATAAAFTTAMQTWCKHVKSRYPPEVLGSAQCDARFAVLVKGETYAILERCEDPNGDGGAAASMDPFKIHLSAEILGVLRVGDEARFGVRFLLGESTTSVAVPYLGADHRRAPAGARALPSRAAVRLAMQRAQDDDDALAFASAFAQYQRLMRVDQLVGQGEVAPTAPLAPATTELAIECTAAPMMALSSQSSDVDLVSLSSLVDEMWA